MIMFAIALAQSTGATPNPTRCPLDGTQQASTWMDECNDAVNREMDKQAKSELLFRRAYTKNERQKSQEALQDLNSALELYPKNASALHERGYTLSSLGRHREAIIDLDAEIALRPDHEEPYRERAYSRHLIADFRGAFEDREKAAKYDPDQSGALAARAEAALWLGDFEQADRDAAAARKAAMDDDHLRYADKLIARIAMWRKRSPGPQPEANCLAASQSGKFDSPTLIGDCTLAWLHSTTPKQKAEALTTRSIAWPIVAQDEYAASADKQIAVALEPENPDWHTNLGFAYLANRHSWGALQEFKISLAIKESAMVLAGSGNAKYNLGDFDGAFRDAKRSFEIEANEVALIVLGDIAFNRLKDPKSAKLYWMGAYHIGNHSDDLVERLKTVGVTDPQHEAVGE